MRRTDADSFTSGRNGSKRVATHVLQLRSLPSYSPTLRSKLSALSTRLSGQGEKVPSTLTSIGQILWSDSHFE